MPEIDPIFLTVEQVLHLHTLCIEQHGGSHGLRDLGLLEAAVSMPKATFGGAFLHEGLPAMAAAYLYHLCKNHPFVDGNKRVAVTAAEVFLDLNGFGLDLNDEELEALTLAVASGNATKDEVALQLTRLRATGT